MLEWILWFQLRHLLTISNMNTSISILSNQVLQKEVHPERTDGMDIKKKKKPVICYHTNQHTTRTEIGFIWRKSWQTWKRITDIHHSEETEKYLDECRWERGDQSIPKHKSPGAKANGDLPPKLMEKLRTSYR